MNAHAAPISDERTRLSRLRDLHARSGADRLSLAISGGTLMLEGVEPGTGEDGRIAVFDPHVGYETVEFLAAAHGHVRFLLAPVDRAAKTVRAQRKRIQSLETEMDWYRRALEQAGEPAVPPDDLSTPSADTSTGRTEVTTPDAEGARPNGRPSSCEAPSGAPAEGRNEREDRTVPELGAGDRSPPRPEASGEAALGREDRSKDYAAEAAMKCADGPFQAFLAGRAGRPCPDADAAAHLLRGMLAIPSRKLLNTDPAAAERWRALKADFDAWRTHG